MNKISIVIPNYNCEKYIEKCLESVINQDYADKEIIIVDDGSSDNSVNVINDYIKKHENDNIKLICQKNLNASIARNVGMNIATGKYILFLDSDDELEDEIISKGISILEKDKTDLLIGNYEVINQDNKILKKNCFFREKKIYSGEEIYKELLLISPVPSNKIYNMEIIEKNNLYWGNVRIGQDLNFFLKYASQCNKVSTINDNIYKYRIVDNSISRTYDYRILDIVTSFNDVKQYYKKINKFDYYEKYIQVLELKNYNFQIWKQIYFKTYKERKMIIDFFAIQEKKICYNKCLNYNNFFRNTRLKFKIKVIGKHLYASNIVSSYIKKKKDKER